MSYGFAEVIRDVAATSGERNPSEVGRIAAARLINAGDDLAGPLLEAAGAYARSVLGFYSLDAGGQIVSDPQASHTPGVSRFVKPAHMPPPFGQRVSLGPGDWRFLGEMTAAEIKQAVEYKRQKAAEVYAAADRLERVLTLFDSAGTDDRLADIADPEDVAELLTRKEADDAA